MPAVDAQSGRLLMAARHALALSPDGTGGIVAAMQRAGVLRDLQRRGLRHVFYMQVDNPLVNVCDLELLGYHRLSGAELSTQVVAKASPLEPLGNVVSIDGKVRILEYSDLARVAAAQPCIAERRQPDGTSVFWAGNMGIHVIEVDFLLRMAAQEELLPFHVARKKVPHVDLETGQVVAPAQENALKFERFVFDMLPAARQAIVVEADKATQFAPLKNRSGAAQDTPEQVQAQMLALHRSWLHSAGATVSPQARVEISPTFALDLEQLRQRLPRGMRFHGDHYLCEPGVTPEPSRP